MKIEVDSLCQGYGKDDVLKNITFSSNEGEMLALLGPNGSGKSTLIKTLCNIMEPRSGTVCIDGKNLYDMELTDIAKIISYVPQSGMASVYTKVIDTVLIGRRPHVGWTYSEKDIDIAIESMQAMKVESLSDRNTAELSGGQKQRVYMARSLAQSPSFFMLDEPTSALDLRHQMNMMVTMRKLIEERDVGVIVALHDINLALNYSDRVMMIKDGEIYAIGEPESTITEENINEVYGVEAEIVTSKNGGRYLLPLSPRNNSNDDF